MAQLERGGYNMTDEAKALGLTASRRQFGIMGAVAAMAGLAQPAAAAVGTRKITEAAVSVPTPYGASSARFFHPATGQHRGLVMWGADASSQKVAQSLASQGWAVLLVSPGSGADEHLDRQINKEARAYVAWLEAQDVVASTGKGAELTGATVGYGYKLRGVSAALPRFSFANDEQRKVAAASATLFAVPDAVVPSHRTARLQDAARMGMSA